MTEIEGDFSLICHFFLMWRIHVCPSICAIIDFIIIKKCRASLVIQWLRFCLPVQVIWVRSVVGGVKIPYALQPKSQNIKQKQYCSRFNKDFKKERSI